MDVRLLNYILAIERYGNITKAAEQLYVTPSALNQQLLKLEKELNTPLFTRSSRRMIPTTAGEVYLSAARQVLDIRRATYEQLIDLSNHTVSTYHVGLTYDHGGSVFARIYAAFHARYPNIHMRCHQALVPIMTNMLQEGELDLVFLLRSKNSPLADIEEIPLSEENLMLGLPLHHPLAREREAHGVKTLNLCQLSGDSFALAPKTTTMRSELIDPLFALAGYEPDIMLESSSNSLLEQLTAHGICNCIIPQSQIRRHGEVAWYYLEGTPRFQFSIGYGKGFYLNKALRYFVELARQDAQLHFNFAPPEKEETP